ncbi:hypothetical protein P9112_007511 [Eukaryota sp. TZLM1-RC]
MFRNIVHLKFFVTSILLVAFPLISYPTSMYLASSWPLPRRRLISAIASFASVHLVVVSYILMALREDRRHKIPEKVE